MLRARGYAIVSNVTSKASKERSGNFLQPVDDANQELGKQVRALRKKLQQIEILEAKMSNGHVLDDQQMAKLKKKSALENSLFELGVTVELTEATSSSSVEQDGKGEKKSGMSKKQRKKSKPKPNAEPTGDCSSKVGSIPLKGSLDIEHHIPQVEVSFLFFKWWFYD